MKSADPTRLVNNASGWTDAKAGDVIDVHSYPEPLMPDPDGVRAAVLGEFGGLGLSVDGHTWSEKSWAYQTMTDSESLTDRCCSLLRAVTALQHVNGLAAAVYTQLTDIETECNGFLTYDREVLKVDHRKVYRANFRESLIPAGIMVLPTAMEGQHTWRYSTNQPPANWMEPGFGSSNWEEGYGGFGSSGTPGTVLGTEWKTRDIWLRREFTLPEPVPSVRTLVIHHDDTATVYLNGVLAARGEDYTVGYEAVPISSEARAALRPGRNVIAIHCHQKSGGQFIDAGLLAPSSQ